MKYIIKLDNRYGENNYLKRVKDKTYKLHTELDTIRGGFIGEKKFLDPSGGPMIVEGNKLEEANAIVKSIEGNLITFE